MAPFLVLAAVGGILAVLVTVGIRFQKDGANAVNEIGSTAEERAVYVIGDLHGDVDCGKYWVDRLQLADLEKKQWLKPDASLVFL